MGDVLTRSNLCICPWPLRRRPNALHTKRCAKLATGVQFVMEERDQYRRESAEHLSLLDGPTALALVRPAQEPSDG